MTSIIPLLRQLKDVPVPVLEQRIAEMLENGYQCVGVFDQGRLIAISGIWILVKYYLGRHVEMDDVVVDEPYRSQGIGELLVAWVDQYARDHGCLGAELNCFHTNLRGQAFWSRTGYQPVGVHFQKKY